MTFVALEVLLCMLHGTYLSDKKISPLFILASLCHDLVCCGLVFEVDLFEKQHYTAFTLARSTSLNEDSLLKVICTHVLTAFLFAEQNIGTMPLIYLSCIFIRKLCKASLTTMRYV